MMLSSADAFHFHEQLPVPLRAAQVVAKLELLGRDVYSPALALEVTRHEFHSRDLGLPILNWVGAAPGALGLVGRGYRVAPPKQILCITLRNGVHGANGSALKSGNSRNTPVRILERTYLHADAPNRL